jgi:hypothetical protein
MKKFLLIAAMAALALGASADGYKIEKVWENTDVASLWVTGVRQGVGMNGKFYINDMRFNGGDTDYTIYIYGENGLEGTMPGFPTAAITHDEAGNLVTMTNTTFAAHTNDESWTASIKVVDPTTGNFKEYTIPEDAALSGRCDFVGFPKGNLMEDGQVFITSGANLTFFSVITISDGEIDNDECYHVTNDLTLSSTSTVINYYTDVDGEEALLYVTRNAPIVKIPLNDLTGGKKIAFPHKGACNGAFPFVWDGKELCVYPITPNYQNGFAVGEAGADDPIVEVASTVTGNANAFQADWLNAEVDENGVTIYQYYPGGHITVWRLTKDEPVTPVYILGEVNDQGWAANAGVPMQYDAENGVYTATVTLDGRGESGENYFSFTTELAEYNDDGGWAYIEPFRFGAVSEGDFWYSDQLAGWPLSLTYDNGQAFRVMGGEYTLKLDLENMKLFVEKVGVEGLRGDVNGDTFVNITDVITLINAILSSNFDGIYMRNADVDYSYELNISDVIKVINFVSTGNW